VWMEHNTLTKSVSVVKSCELCRAAGHDPGTDGRGQHGQMDNMDRMDRMDSIDYLPILSIMSMQSTMSTPVHVRAVTLTVARPIK